MLWQELQIGAEDVAAEDGAMSDDKLRLVKKRMALLVSVARAMAAAALAARVAPP